jgi:hypothetical protein
MSALLKPAIALMNRLRYAQKFTLIIALFLLPHIRLDHSRRGRPALPQSRKRVDQDNCVFIMKRI